MKVYVNWNEKSIVSEETKDLMIERDTDNRVNNDNNFRDFR